MEIISSGEVVPGMIVVCYESTEIHRYVNQITGALQEQHLPSINPWFKGIPYEVVNRAGPILAVKTNGLQKHPPIVFIDTRLTKLMQVSKEYHDEYVAHMNPKVQISVPETEPKKVVNGSN